MSYSRIHAIMKDKMDCIAFHKDNSLLLATSGLTNRSWNGSVWYCPDASTVTDPEQCTAGSEIGCGASDCQWVPESSRFLLACDSGAVMLWEVSEDKTNMTRLAEPIEHDDMAVSVSATCDGKTAVSTGNDRRIKVWSIEEMTSEHTYKAHADMVTCVDCHPSDSQIFASCARDGKLLLWDLRKPKPASSIDKLHLPSNPTVVQWNPAQPGLLAVGTETGHVIITDTRNNDSTTISLPVHSRPVSRLAFSHKQNWLASASEDCMVSVLSYDKESAKIIYQDKKHTDYVRGVTWRPNDDRLFSASWDCTVVGREVLEMEPILLNPLATLALNSSPTQPERHNHPAELMDTGVPVSPTPLVIEAKG